MRLAAIPLLAMLLVGLIASGASGTGEGPDLAALAGVYKVRFENGLVTGEKFQSEDILEIVPTAPDAVYFRTHLEFYNGHTCALSGIAHRRGADLVYREKLDSPDPGGPRECVLRISQRGADLRLSDENSCKAYCGARGAFEGQEFPAASRRAIRYMDRLKASAQFTDALARDRKQ